MMIHILESPCELITLHSANQYTLKPFSVGEDIAVLTINFLYSIKWH